MLYRNDEKYILSDKDKEDLRKKLGWSKNGRNQKVVFKIPESQYVFDKANNRKVRPQRMNIPLQDKEYSNDGTVKWNYCERPPERDKDGNVKYDRKVYPMTSDFTLDESKVELVWFLVLKSSLRQPNYDVNGNLEPGEKPLTTRPLFYIQNRGKEAEAKLLKRELRSTVESMIIGKNAWSDAQVKKYAIAFGVNVQPDDSIHVVKSDLLGRIEGTKNGYQEFIELSKADEDVLMLFVINTAKKKEKIGFNESKMAWYYKDEKGKFTAEIAKARATVSKERSLLMHYQDFPSDFETLRGLTEID